MTQNNRVEIYPDCLSSKRLNKCELCSPVKAYSVSYTPFSRWLIVICHLRASMPNSTFRVFGREFTHILAKWLRAGADAFVVSIASHYPILSQLRHGFFVGNPRHSGEDGTNQPLLTGSGRMRIEEDDTCHLEVWVWSLPLARDLTVLTWNAVPPTPTP